MSQPPDRLTSAVTVSVQLSRPQARTCTIHIAALAFDIDACRHETFMNLDNNGVWGRSRSVGRSVSPWTDISTAANIEHHHQGI